MKSIFIASVLLISTHLVVAQKGQAPPPEYLKGQSLPDSVMQMQLQNFEGELVSFRSILDKHEGKKIVIDFWASWCRDCIVGLPNLNSLMAETTGLEVDYVFISVDKEVSRWKNAIANFKIEGDHYRSISGWKSPLSNYVVLDWIPRYVVIDEAGTVALPKTVKANDQAMKALLIGEN